MQTRSNTEGIEQKFQGGAVLIGNFDGLHLGHQSLLAQAKATGLPVTVITFDPHPLQVLQPQKGVRRLFPRLDIAEQLPHYGAGLLVVLPFDLKMARTSAEDFWNKYVAEPLKPAHVVAGEDFGFGRSREGSLEFIKDWCARSGARLHVVEPLSADGDIVSSRRIRDLVQAGEVAQAMRLLGRPFYLRGTVERGAGRGAKIGSPTLNLKVENEILPANGVYATQTVIGGRIYPSVTNVGVNPTFGDARDIKVETHIPGESLPTPQGSLDVDFIARIRPEMRFPSIEDLKKQIQSDILKSKAVIEQHEAMDVYRRKS